MEREEIPFVHRGVAHDGKNGVSDTQTSYRHEGELCLTKGSFVLKCSSPRISVGFWRINPQNLDKFTVPLLKGIKTKEPAVIMAALNVFQKVGQIPDTDFMAMDVLLAVCVACYYLV
jgi:hypothetical protein